MHEAAVTSSATGPVDLHTLVGHCLGNEDLALRLLLKFKHRLDEDLVTMSNLLKNRDFKALRELAHRTKGTAAHLRAEPLREVARGLELAAANGDEADSRQALTDVQDAARAYADSLHQLALPPRSNDLASR